ncbi:MAG: tetratricopeptide repeat protein [Planctomycetes bacterium]|nr:tetratricopeptide repeat protein [Planctomycetota bacterium]
MAPFDIASDPIPSFGSLLTERADVYGRKDSFQSFSRQVERLEDGGDPGRRKGLGMWMAGRYEEAAALLAAHEGDDVAAFTRGNALMSLGRAGEARAIFERLSEKYPDEPRPRGAALDALCDEALNKDGEEAAADALEQALAAAPQPFHPSAEGRYLAGRVAELRGEDEAALEAYGQARDVDGTHRRNLFRLGYLAERAGHEDLALEAYEVLVRILPADASVLNNLGVLYEDLGRDQDAAACYDMVAKTYPMDGRARLYLRDALAGMEMYYDEDLERKEDRLNQILRTPITDFELSVRARNCLAKMDIVTLGDLVKKTENELLTYKNFGETSLQEIKEILTSKGLRLGMQREEAVHAIDRGPGAVGGGDPNDPRNKSITELKLSIRARRTVENLGCLTLGEVTQHSEDELLGMPNFGVTSLLELKGKLSEYGLKLKGED